MSSRPGVARLDPVDLPAAPVRRHRDGVDDGVEPGSVASARVDRDAQPVGSWVFPPAGTLSRRRPGGQSSRREAARSGRRALRRRIPGLRRGRWRRGRRAHRLVPLELDLEPERDRPDRAPAAVGRPGPRVLRLELHEDPPPVEVAAQPREEPGALDVDRRAASRPRRRDPELRADPGAERREQREVPGPLGAAAPLGDGRRAGEAREGGSARAAARPRRSPSSRTACPSARSRSRAWRARNARPSGSREPEPRPPVRAGRQPGDDAERRGRRGSGGSPTAGTRAPRRRCRGSSSRRRRPSAAPGSSGKSAETASRVCPTISTRSRRSCLFTPGNRRFAESVVVKRGSVRVLGHPQLVAPAEERARALRLEIALVREEPVEAEDRPEDSPLEEGVAHVEPALVVVVVPGSCGGGCFASRFGFPSGLPAARRRLAASPSRPAPPSSLVSLASPGVAPARCAPPRRPPGARRRGQRGRRRGHGAARHRDVIPCPAGETVERRRARRGSDRPRVWPG